MKNGLVSGVGNTHFIGRILNYVSIAISSHSGCSAPFTAHDGSCFYVSTEAVGWNDAKTRCEDINGHLVMIKTEQQQQKVVNFPHSFGKN